jgi:hypothetical protein
LETEFLLHI